LLTLPTPLPDGAYYLAGYAVECALKACIAKAFVAESWPDKKFVLECHTHDILDLVRLAELEVDRAADIAVNPARKTNWNLTNDWSESSRYERHAQLKAQKLYDAITDPNSGVLPWIKAHW